MIRSETLNYYSITFSYDNAFEAVEGLATLGGIHLDDLQFNSPRKIFAAQAQEASEKLLQLSEIEQLLIEFRILRERLEFDSESAKKVLEKYKGTHKGRSISESRLVDQIQEKHASVYKMLANKQGLRARIEAVQETAEGLEAVRLSLSGAQNFESALANPQIQFVCYALENKHLSILQRVIFRITRGLLFCNYLPTRDGKKTLILILLLKSQMGYLLEKVRGALESSGAREIVFPPDGGEFIERLSRANRARLDAIRTLDKTRERIRELLVWFSEEGEVPGVSRLYEGKVLLIKQRELFAKLGFFVRSGEILEGRFWVPKLEEGPLISQIGAFAARRGFQAFRILKLSISKYDEVPPTKFCPAPLLASFQEIVNTYGVPRYKEINPGVFTVVSFPFLFGVMFGDVGHGALLWALGLLLHRGLPGLPKAISRYGLLISLLGFAAFYCGLVYNEFFSLPLIIQESCYRENGRRKSADCVYAFGIDFVWHGDRNGVGFGNSYKMKMSVVYGVLHMTLGLLLRGWNNLYFREAAAFVFEFLPQLAFFLATFGYMGFCIVAKWLTDFGKSPKGPPSIIGLFINFVTRVDGALYASEADQLVVQRLLASLALACAPLLFLGKPLAQAAYRACGARRARSYRFLSNRSNEPSGLDFLDPAEPEVNESFGSNRIYAVDLAKPAYKILRAREGARGLGEALILQAIEAVEFLLGSVSNTASYLRLWALSLAHGQLARVFFEMLLRPFLAGRNGVGVDSAFIVGGFAIFGLVTFGVLMCMDVMECFLHALRLHWVEFQNKFYKGDGYLFEDFEIVALVEKSFK